MSRTPGKCLDRDEREALMRAVKRGENANEIALMFHAETGNDVSIETINRWRARLEPDRKAPARKGAYALRTPPPSKTCALCREREATVPGVPVGIPGRLCVPCQMSVIDSHREQKWADAQAERRA